VDDPERCGPAFAEALAADRPCVIEVKADPNVPPLSPAITLEQARSFMSALLKGDPEEGGIILETAKQALSNLLPHKS
jgi:pyruvate dehydrogenase (quinone)